jgi:hypothetical protein
VIFLIHYDRRAGLIKSFESYGDSERAKAEAARSTLESSESELTDNEIVLLEAPSETELRRTHRRYFASASDLLKTASDEATTASGKP